jgi:hypothetical protein
MQCAGKPRLWWIATGIVLTGCLPPMESSGLDPDPLAPVALRISPDSAELLVTDTLRFRALAVTAQGDELAVPEVRFETTGGAIDGNGLFLATAEGGFEVRAVFGTGTEQLSALARVRVKPPRKPPPTLVAVALSPDSASVVSGASLQFAAAGRMSDGSTKAVSGAFFATGGLITATGLFTAGATPGSFTVWVQELSASLSDTSGVAILAPPPPPPPPPAGLGLNAALPTLFPASNPWNQPVDTAQVDPNSGAIIGLIGGTKSFHPDFGANWNGGPFGIPYVVVSGTQARVPVAFDYADESDPGPYPIPPNPPIEGGAASSGDRHVLIVDRDAWKLYELFAAYPQSDGSWHAGSGAIFDLGSNALRPAGWTSADAAGLPMLPGLVRYDEVEAGVIPHALRFTVSHTRRAYISPARHWASSDTDPLRPPMGMRVRLRASFNVSGYPARVLVILRALKKYGMIVADNGSDWYLSGVADARWDDSELNLLKLLHGSDFEVVRMTGVVTP